MLELIKLDHRLVFPAPYLALDEPNGLLAFGGDLSVPRLLQAYQQGIFPWFSEGEPLLWWSPDPRGIIELNEFHCSKSLAKLIRQASYKVTINNAFERVIQACSSIPRNDSGTWITKEMVNAYIDMHKQGYAHSVEVWDGPELVGGLYGVCPGNVFCGESMFHTHSNTSKLASYYLVEHLRSIGIAFLDCQMWNPYLASLGCKEIPREAFLNKLRAAVQTHPDHRDWQPVTLVEAE